MKVAEAVPQAFVDAQVLDRHGEALRLGTLFEGRPALVVMLRHYGCIGCAQQLDALVPHAEKLATMGVGLVLVGNGEPAHLDAFIERQRLEGYPLELVCDPSLRAYAALGLERSIWRVFGPVALAREVVGRARGYWSSSLEGDVLQQGGVLLLDAAGIVQFFAEAQVAAEPVAAARIVDAAMALVLGQAQAGDSPLLI